MKIRRLEEYIYIWEETIPTLHAHILANVDAVLSAFNNKVTAMKILSFNEILFSINYSAKFSSQQRLADAAAFF